ncbi:aspartate beta-hydroxylase [Sarotherodon galilaeus]
MSETRPTHPVEALTQMMAELAGIHKEQAAPAAPPAFLEVFQAPRRHAGGQPRNGLSGCSCCCPGKPQVAALSLPATARASFPDVWRAILDQLGLSSEDHQCHFLEGQMGPEDRPFTFGRGLHNTAARWLQPAPTPGEARLLNMVVLEQLVEGLRARTTEWVCCCWLASLKAAWTLAKDRLATQLEHPWEQPWSAARDRLVLAPRRRVLGPPPLARGLSCLLIPFPLGSLCRFPPLRTPFPPHPGQHRCWAGVLEVLATRAAPLGLPVNGDGTGVLDHWPSDALPRFRTYLIHQTLVRPGALLEAEWVERADRGSNSGDIAVLEADHRPSDVAVQEANRGSSSGGKTVQAANQAGGDNGETLLVADRGSGGHNAAVQAMTEQEVDMNAMQHVAWPNVGVEAMQAVTWQDVDLQAKQDVDIQGMAWPNVDAQALPIVLEVAWQDLDMQAPTARRPLAWTEQDLTVHRPLVCQRSRSRQRTDLQLGLSRSYWRAYLPLGLSQSHRQAELRLSLLCSRT